VPTSNLGNVTGIGNGLPSGVNNLAGDGDSWFFVASAAFPTGPEIVDDDARTTLRQQEGVGPSNPASRSRDDGHPPLEGQPAHLSNSLRSSTLCNLPFFS
jgi:hypothetical protein